MISAVAWECEWEGERELQAAMMIGIEVHRTSLYSVFLLSTSP